MANSDPAAAPDRAPPPPGDHGVVLDQPFDMNSLYAMRAALVAHGSELGAAGPALERLVLVASELATNAVRHGGGHGRLRLWRTAEWIFCQVSDGGPGIADPQVGTRQVDATEVGGRGLWICRQLADSLTIASGSPGSVVTASIAVAAAVAG
jgi:anti-sigma regulatory factor (Ser/Thr protein kinase)